jgi:CheY-specific phosphatase CheX
MAPNDELQQVFLESASEVLETMCFVGVLGEQAEPAGADLISAELAFNGKPSGRFGVQVPSSTGRLIASNFLGKDPEEITEAEIDQVVGELANMICGSVLSRVEAGSRFELLHPVIMPPGQGISNPEAVTNILELEEGSIVLWMIIQDTVPACSAA